MHCSSLSVCSSAASLPIADLFLFCFSCDVEGHPACCAASYYLFSSFNFICCQSASSCSLSTFPSASPFHRAVTATLDSTGVLFIIGTHADTHTHTITAASLLLQTSCIKRIPSCFVFPRINEPPIAQVDTETPTELLSFLLFFFFCVASSRTLSDLLSFFS